MSIDGGKGTILTSIPHLAQKSTVRTGCCAWGALRQKWPWPLELTAKSLPCLPACMFCFSSFTATMEDQIWGKNNATLFPTPKMLGSERQSSPLEPQPLSRAEAGSAAHNFTVKLIPYTLEGIGDDGFKWHKRNELLHFMVLKTKLINPSLLHLKHENPM